MDSLQRPAITLDLLFVFVFDASLLCLLLHGPGDGGGATQAGLSLLSDARQQLLDLSNGAARVEALGTGLGAVHDGVTSAR